MKRIFLSVPFREAENKIQIENLCNLVTKAGFEVFCFVKDVEKFSKFSGTSFELMKKAKEEISKSDYFLIDYDGPSTGRMIELGIAFALNKKVIVLKQRNIDLKNTVEGVSQFVIEYENLEDIVEKLKIL